MEVVKDVLIGLTSLIIGYCYFNFQLVFSSTMNPGTHIAAQEKWGGERRETAEGGEEGEESKVEKPPLLFEAMTLSLVRSLARSLLRRGGPSLPSSFLPQLQLSQMTRRFHDLGRQTDRQTDRTKPRIHTG